MKAGIIFESQSELTKRIPIDFIAEEWCNYESFENLYLTTKIRLQKAGYDSEKVAALAPLIRKAKLWAFQVGTPHNTVVSYDELAMWDELRKITEIVANI